MALDSGKNNDDLLVFAGEGDGDAPIFQAEEKQKRAWKILVVDDEPAIHGITRIALNGFRFMGRNLEILGAYTGMEGRHYPLMPLAARH